MSLTYSMGDEDGNVLEQSDLPVSYIHGGSTELIGGMDQALAGKRVGDEVELHLAPEAGFGPHDPNLTFTDDLANVPPEFRLVGAEVQMQNDAGEIKTFYVTRIEDGRLTVDGNHPLAGKALQGPCDGPRGPRPDPGGDGPGRRPPRPAALRPVAPRPAHQPTGTQAMKLGVVILAAGQGTRMRSDLPKVLHPLAGRPLLAHVLDAADGTWAAERTCVVYGHGGEAGPGRPGRCRDCAWVEQAQRLGTAHAVMQAMPAMAGMDRVLVLYGDVPLIRAGDPDAA